MSKQITVAFLLSESDPGKDNYCREEETLYLFHAERESHPTYPTRAREQGVNKRAKLFTVVSTVGGFLPENSAILRNAARMPNHRIT